ncbi:MAG: tRNA glutamyl-Q(34) synthetase GluQRS [Flaviflexus sp.]|nr:tRNA glutamyl-Q(34) synthetase GluQRS [Flaviflexus sp.]
MTGRFAPSPTGSFHVGNLRTGLIAWAQARSQGSRFVMRMEDIDDRSRPEHGQSQLADLTEIGIDWDELVYQSARRACHDRVIEELLSRGLLYECYCTRADIARAPTAPHAPPGAYPGTCRNLSDKEREAGRAKLSGMNRGPALRLKTSGEAVTVRDEICGEHTGYVDDFVIRRGDGAVAYNLVCVVDDGTDGITEIVRADDLLSSTPRQVYLQRLLGIDTPAYYHVPLVVNREGKRLAKRDGDVTLQALKERGWSVREVIELITDSLGMRSASAEEFLERFNIRDIPREPWVFIPPAD